MIVMMVPGVRGIYTCAQLSYLEWPRHGMLVFVVVTWLAMLCCCQSSPFPTGQHTHTQLPLPFQTHNFAKPSSQENLFRKHVNHTLENRDDGVQKIVRVYKLYNQCSKKYTQITEKHKVNARASHTSYLCESITSTCYEMLFKCYLSYKIQSQFYVICLTSFSIERTGYTLSKVAIFLVDISNWKRSFPFFKIVLNSDLRHACIAFRWAWIYWGSQGLIGFYFLYLIQKIAG